MSKLYQYAGYTIRTGEYKSKGLFKLRVSNSPERAKTLKNTENEMIVMFKLPKPMSKDRAAFWLADKTIDGLSPLNEINS